MDDKLLLAKSVALLYRESQLPDKSSNSSDLVRTVLESIKLPDIGIGLNPDRDIILQVKQTVMEMCNNPFNQEYEKEELLQRLRINSSNDERYYQSLAQGIEPEMTESKLRKTIILHQTAINNHFRQEKIGAVMNKFTADFNYRREGIKDFNQWLMDLQAQLEPLAMASSSVDTAILSEVDVGNTSVMTDLFNNIKSLNSGEKVYKVAWPELNDMTQGGFRPGENWNFNGLQHEYKTGFSLSVFAQIALCNKPLTADPAKKPLMVRITFEDPLENNFQFLYQYLKYSETGEKVDIRDISIDDMIAYIQSSLQVNGFHVKFLRVDPNGWTYKSIFNKILEYEALGYQVEILALDYLHKLPTTGCTIGPAGTDVMDMLSRVKNFCASKGIVLLNNHQLSTEAKNLLRSGIPEDMFVKELVGRGYFEGSKGLDRIYDGGILFHKFKHEKNTYFAVQLDKHRFPTVVSDDLRFYMMMFPKNMMPIPHNTEGRYTSFKKLSAANTNASEELFAFG